jgi:hypothetical protein
MKIKQYLKKLSSMNACQEAIIDIAHEPSLRKLTLAKARCAKLVLHLMKDERSKNAVKVAEMYGLGKATRQDLDKAAAAAADAYAYAADAAYAAYAAADAFAAAAADAAYAFAYAAYAAAYADAADAAAYAFAAAARRTILNKCANIIREQYPKINQLGE